MAEQENNDNKDEDDTSQDANEKDTINDDAKQGKNEINPLDELSTADIVEFVGTKTAKITNPFIASSVVGAVSAINFFIDHFNDGKGKKKKKKKKNKNKKNNKDK